TTERNLKLPRVMPNSETTRTAPLARVSRPAGFRPARFALAAFALAVLAGCQSVDFGDESAFRPSKTPVTIDTVTRHDRLADVAREQHPRILATYGGEYSDQKLERMVARIVGQLIAASEEPNQTYRVTILNSPSVNAFALPG